MDVGVMLNGNYQCNIFNFSTMRKKLFTVKIVIDGEQKIAGKTIARTQRSAKRKVFARLQLRHPNLKLNQLL